MSSISAISKYFRVCLGVTILSPPEQYLNKLFISAVNPMFWLWLGVTVHVLRHLHAQYCPFQSHQPPPPPSIPFPPVLYFGFQHATQPLHRGVQTREASVYSVSPDTRQWSCSTARFSPLRVYVYSCVLIWLFCRHCGSVITPIVTRSLPCICHVPVYMLAFKQ